MTEQYHRTKQERIKRPLLSCDCLRPDERLEINDAILFAKAYHNREIKENKAIEMATASIRRLKELQSKIEDTPDCTWEEHRK